MCGAECAECAALGMSAGCSLAPGHEGNHYCAQGHEWTPVGQGGYTPAEGSGYTPADQVGYTPAGEGAYTAVDQGGYVPADEGGYTPAEGGGYTPAALSSGGADAGGAPSGGVPDGGTHDGGAPDGGTPGGGAADGQGSDLTPSGAHPSEVPASFAVGGLPAFRYNLPEIPIATAHVDTPEVSFDVELLLRGSVTVTFPNPPQGVSTDVNSGGWRVEAVHSLDGLTSGLRVNGLGTTSPSIGSTLGNEFETAEVRLSGPNAVSFIGQGRIGYTVDSSLGPVAVQGQAGCELKVTAYPHPVGVEPVPVTVDSTESWLSHNAGPLAVIGAIVLAGIAIAAAPETGGASLLLLAGA